MYETQELQFMDPVHMGKGPQASQLEANGAHDRDRDELARLGKKQVLKVRVRARREKLLYADSV